MKKSQESSASKNQEPITAFFKNSDGPNNVAISRKTNYLPSAKRKATCLDNDHLISQPVKLKLMNKETDTNKKLKQIKIENKDPLKQLEHSPIFNSLPDISNLQCFTFDKKDFEQDDVSDVFNDDWEHEEDAAAFDKLNLNKMQRCEVISLKNHENKMELFLKSGEMTGTCFVEGIWKSIPLSPGDIISVIAAKNETGQHYLNDTTGLLVLRPDHLISSTSVVAGVFCKRKAVLQERWRGIDSANTAMTIGIMVHELVQKALTQQISDITQLRLEADRMIRESIQMLYDAGMTEEETRTSMQCYIQPLNDFMKSYVVSKASHGIMQNNKENWNGHIDKVLDIEENICCPQLGLKGKIDATLQVTVPEKNGLQKAIVPLELKSGKASVSAEHRGQLVMYGMMLSLHRNEDPTVALQRGLLLYLRDKVDVREVNCGYPERRDLVMLRNQLVENLASDPKDPDPEQLTDIEDASFLLQQKLPEPINHERACTKCPYLSICSVHLWHSGGPSVSENHPLSKLQGQALGHLSKGHIKYFFHWTALLKMEEKFQTNSSPLQALWTESAEKREKRGTCIPNLKIKAVEQSGEKHLHVFRRSGVRLNREKGPQEGEFAIVSIEGRPWVAAGVVSSVSSDEVQIHLERDLSKRLCEDTLYHIDSYESYSTIVQNLSNLGVLLEYSERSERLRTLIIDKTKPQFEAKLPREVGRLGIKLMRSLNIEQQRAVLKALSAQDYALLQGLPGTGKTQTISVLIQMLVGLKQRVLVTAHTHSAVDTLLSRLPETMKVMRLGSTARVDINLLHRTEKQLTASCRTVEELARLYDSMEVIGVTCLGSTHAILSRTTFDMCIVDEATQVLQCTVLRPLFAARRFLLVGDPKQLPPIVKSRAARRLGMEESLFHRLMDEEATCTLHLQYRMNQAITDVANQVAYDSRLKCANGQVALATLSIDMQKLSSKTEWLKRACSPEPEDAVLFLDMKSTNVFDFENESRSCRNKAEACLVLDLMECFKEGGVSSKNIGIIAPYREQVSLLRRALASYSVEVNTVDQFQGRDKSILIYSCTKWNVSEDHKVKEGEILNDDRRLAVSVTRAKHKFIIVGNSKALHCYVPLQRLIRASATVSLNDDIVKCLYHKYKEIMI
ncbi:DNA replication ATP-dependent helicase/nuclease DNA2 [Bombyx mori]|uniref:DNA replication ATP-dependent helicase/nuclease n=2 Tax=Bombyx mori TaxID=7091 RepID=A0A8R1WLQ8_BOMMO|nr:DNA replication ATP-dependent helicase/nuclease DNA2 isoform X1 [Bombyx mori]